MDNDILIKFKILHRLNLVRKEKGLYARADLKEIADELSIDFGKFMMCYANELFTMGQISMDVGNHAYIEPKGIAILEANNPFYQELRSPEAKNINIHAPVTGSSIILGDNNNVNVTFDFLAKLEKEIKQSSLSSEEKKTWLSRIKDISSHPILASLVTKTLEMIVKS